MVCTLNFGVPHVRNEFHIQLEIDGRRTPKLKCDRPQCYRGFVGEAFFGKKKSAENPTGREQRKTKMEQRETKSKSVALSSEKL
jgi:hypothetical protein